MYMHVYARISMYERMYVYVCICTYQYLLTYICAYTCIYVQYVHTHTAVHIHETYRRCTYVRMCKYICLTYVHIRKLVFIYVHIRTVRFTDGKANLEMWSGKCSLPPLRRHVLLCFSLNLMIIFWMIFDF